MKYQFKTTFLIWIILIITPILSSFTGCNCLAFTEQGVRITVVNQTDQGLVIYIHGLRESEVPPGASIEFGTTNIAPKNVYSAEEKFLIEAKTKTGEVVYSKNYTWQELDDLHWTIIIPPEGVRSGPSVIGK